MDSSAWKPIGKLARWAGIVFGAIDIAVAIRETLTRPNRDVFTEMLGSVVSLHSIYLGAAVGGSIIMLVCSWPLFQWLWAIPDRRKKKEQEFNRQIIGDLENLRCRIDLVLNETEIIGTVNRETIRVMMDDLNAIGFDFQETYNERDFKLADILVDKYLPHVRLHGVQRVIDEMIKR